MKKKTTKFQLPFDKKVILIPTALLIALLSFVGGSQYQKSINKLPEQQNSSNTTFQQLPTRQTVKRVIDGDTVELANGQLVRLVGVNTPTNGDPFEEEATEYTKKLVEGKKVRLEYDAYKSNRFGRILAYVIINDKNLSIELVKKGLAKVVIYEKRKPLIYHQQLLDAEKEAKNNKLGIWSLPK